MKSCKQYSHAADLDGVSIFWYLLVASLRRYQRLGLLLPSITKKYLKKTSVNFTELHAAKYVVNIPPQHFVNKENDPHATRKKSYIVVDSNC